MSKCPLADLKASLRALVLVTAFISAPFAKAEEATLVEGRQAKNLMKAIEEANKLTGSQSVCIINDCYSIVTNLNCGLISNKRDQFKSGSCNFENGSGVSATVRDEVAGRILKAVENAGFNVELYVNHKYFKVSEIACSSVKKPHQIGAAYNCFVTGFDGTHPGPADKGKEKPERGIPTVKKSVTGRIAGRLMEAVNEIDELLGGYGTDCALGSCYAAISQLDCEVHTGRLPRITWAACYVEGENGTIYLEDSKRIANILYDSGIEVHKGLSGEFFMVKSVECKSTRVASGLQYSCDLEYHYKAR